MGGGGGGNGRPCGLPGHIESFLSLSLPGGPGWRGRRCEDLEPQVVRSGQLKCCGSLDAPGYQDGARTDLVTWHVRPLVSRESDGMGRGTYGSMALSSAWPGCHMVLSRHDSAAGGVSL